MKVRIKSVHLKTSAIIVGASAIVWVYLGLQPASLLLICSLGLMAFLQHQSQLELNQVHEKLSAVYDDVDEPIFILDSVEKITFVNQAAKNMFRNKKNSLIGTPMAGLLEVDGVRPSSLQTITDSIQAECSIVLEETKSIPMEISISSHETSVNMSYTVFIRDISARKFYEELLIDAKDDAEALGKSKTEFLATMSHEIRTPMNGVLGMTQLMLDMDLNVEQREAAKVVYSSAESLLTVINDILDYSKIESGKMDLEKIPFNLHASIGEVVELLSGQARAKGLELLVDYDPDTPVALIGDVGRVRQIVMNLLGNALKFTETGHVLVKIKGLPTTAGDVLVKVEIIDTGIGIAKSAQASLFESFTQADASTTRKFGGTGLGLAISRQLVELMGGEIGVESVQDEGSTFWFTFAAEIEKLQVQQMQCIDFSEFAGKRALLLDDHSIGLQILTRMFSNLGFETCGVNCATDCLTKLKEESFDIVVLDYMMPEMDGEELLRRISALPELNPLITLMLTSSGLIGQKERLLAKGLDGYLLKPLIRQDLIVELSRQFNPQTSVVVQPSTKPQEERKFQLRVLLAEDNIVNQKVATKMLEKAGCRVDIAANGAEAIKMWQDFNYQLIFMDCQMPELDGLKATQRIRSLENRNKLKRIPIIALTANAMERDQDACIDAGMDDYVAKPVRRDLLLDAVEKWSGDTPTTVH